MYSARYTIICANIIYTQKTLYTHIYIRYIYHIHADNIGIAANKSVERATHFTTILNDHNAVRQANMLLTTILSARAGPRSLCAHMCDICSWPRHRIECWFFGHFNSTELAYVVLQFIYKCMRPPYIPYALCGSKVFDSIICSHIITHVCKCAYTPMRA